MTQDASPAAPTTAEEQHALELREARFTRKLVLAVLSTLQHKGLLKAAEVDALLLAARRAADASVTAAAGTVTAGTVAAPMLPASAPAPATPLGAAPGVAFTVRAEPAKPIALYAPAGSSHDAASHEGVSVERAAAGTPEGASQRADGSMDAARPETGEARGRDAKAPPVFDIQID
ncbi:hypothetical protein [Deinococcus sp.]|uniref:hypothetical protein n=1 Tax=Deinococcus sp. TaxID=47478 RepID=UPI003CC5EFEF